LYTAYIQKLSEIFHHPTHLSLLLYINIIHETVEMEMILSKNYNSLKMIVSFAVMYDEENIIRDLN
jgi:hypothetical protein